MESPGLATFRKVTKKYPGKGKIEILNDAIEHTLSEQGKWFATAKQLGLLELAAELAQRSPVEPKTLNKAAMDFLDSNPDFALRVAMASLHWLSKGWGYDIMASDVHCAYKVSIEAGHNLGRLIEVEQAIVSIVEQDESTGKIVKRALASLINK